MGDNLSFAWRCWEIKPSDLPPNSPWPDHNSIDQPKPPRKWRRQGFSIRWHRWRSATALHDSQVSPRETFSLAWCQRTQQCWVVRGDCTDQNAPDYSRIYENWETLCCRHLQAGLWQLDERGNARQHDSHCPTDFDEFLPKNFFMGIVPEQQCHFVGHLSLILGLLAMCPGNVGDIPGQIDEIFYHKNDPQFIPCRRYGGSPMNRLGRLDFLRRQYGTDEFSVPRTSDCDANRIHQR